jgi:hypothetical protein
MPPGTGRMHGKVRASWPDFLSIPPIPPTRCCLVEGIRPCLVVSCISRRRALPDVYTMMHRDGQERVACCVLRYRIFCVIQRIRRWVPSCLCNASQWNHRSATVLTPATIALNTVGPRIASTNPHQLRRLLRQTRAHAKTLRRIMMAICKTLVATMKLSPRRRTEVLGETR